MSSDNGSLSDTEKLLIAFIKQVYAKGESLPKPDYGKLAEDLGLPSTNSAQIRWSRLTTKIRNNEFPELKIESKARGGSTRKRSKTDAELGGEDDEDIAGLETPSKKQKSGGVLRKAGGDEKNLEILGGGFYSIEFKSRLFKNAVDKTPGDDIKHGKESAKVGNAAQNKTGGDSSTVGQQAAMIEQLANGKRGKGNRKRPVMKGPDKQTSTAVAEPFQDATAGDSLGVGTTTAIVDKPAGSRRGRKRSAVDEGQSHLRSGRELINRSPRP
ncbi:hypothetical protein DSL72_008360 [Monilinia vaccinii-corymbosi]|uniref:Myb-like DNA-binding domain-containing protein n=1 Tax=Monilinia vaccinii-corymbosi TaxID=61207 RepID=A0A8A3PK64_9HELO|nr:hypothetical protein DSL72_008360 [Monilinia vaccinii-corymbosi]